MGVAQRFVLKPLPVPEARGVLARLDTSLLPDGAKGLQFVRGQVFRVETTGKPEVSVLPVQFYTAEPGLVQGIDRRTDLCGLLLVDAAGKTRFEPLADNGTDGAVQCSGVQGVGLARPTGDHPEVLMLFRVHTVHRSWSDPYAVTWSGNDGRYVMEHLSLPAGMATSDTLTIPQLRRWVNAGK
ncbi:hypothetical protein GCM10022270_34510 [Terriglobus aquaticus]